MSNRLYNSVFESLLVRLHQAVAPRLDLTTGLFGWLYVTAYFAYKRVHDRTLIKVAKQLIKPETLVIDIGANIGFFSFAIVDTNRPVTILAFEPAPDNIRRLNALVTVRAAQQCVFPYPIALSDRAGTATLYLSDFAPTDHKLIPSRSSQSVEVPTLPLDDFIVSHPQFSALPISLIKIDVQGAELLVLHGMVRTLEANHYPPILVEYAPNDLAAAHVTPKDFFAAFAALGYQPHSIPTLAPLSPDTLIETLPGAYADLLMLSSRSR